MKKAGFRGWERRLCEIVAWNDRLGGLSQKSPRCRFRFRISNPEAGQVRLSSLVPIAIQASEPTQTKLKFIFEDFRGASR